MKLHKPLDEAVYDKEGNEVPQVNTIDNPLYYNECRSCRNFFDENLLGFLSLALIFLLINLITRKNYLLNLILNISFFFRAIFLIVDHLFIQRNRGGDAGSFETFAAFWSSKGFPELFYYFFQNGASWTYANLISVVYAIFGRSHMMMEAINIFFGMLLIILSYRFVYLITSNYKRALFISIILSFHPIIFYLSTISIRDIIVIYLLTLAIYYFTIWVKKDLFIYFVLSIFLSSIQYFFHGPLILLIFPMTFFYFLRIFRKISNNSNILPIFSLLFFSILIYVFYATNLLLLINIPYVGYIFNMDLSNKLIEIYNNANYGATTFPSYIFPNNFFEILLFFPLKVLHFLFGPFIWEINTFSKLIIFFDSSLYLILFIILLTYINKIFNNESLTYIFLFSLFIIFIYTLGTGNYGTSIRHKCKILLLILVLISAIVPSFKLKFTYEK